MRKNVLFNVGVVATIAAIGIGTYAELGRDQSSSSTRTTLATAKVQPVLSSVSATGNVQSVSSLSLSFQQSGTVTAIAVHAGDHVRKGEVLARVDDTQQQAALATARAQLSAAQAAYDGDVRGETSAERTKDAKQLTSTAESVVSAQLGVQHAQQTADENATKNQQQVTQAQASVTAAQKTVSTATTGRSIAVSSLHQLQASYDPNASSSESDDARLARYHLDQVDCAAHTSTPGYHTSDGVDCSQITNLISFATSLQSAATTLSQAQSSLTTAQSSLTSAQQNSDAGSLQDQQSIDNAKQQLASAQAQYDSTEAQIVAQQQPAKPEQLAQAQASIVSAEQQEATAAQNLDDTVLRAPADGVVASVSGTVGAQASGGSASTATTSASSATSTSSSSSSGFITLTNLDELTVKVGFTESDATKVRVGADATITLDAISGATFTGKVLELDAAQTVVNNVVTYYSTVSLEDATAQIKPGMTASVSVVLDKREAVVTLPTSAVPTSGTTAVVTVRTSSGKEAQRTVAIGLRGDNAVEITSGLRSGEQVVVRSSTGSTTGGFQPPGAGGLGGLGGGPGR